MVLSPQFLVRLQEQSILQHISYPHCFYRHLNQETPVIECEWHDACMLFLRVFRRTIRFIGEDDGRNLAKGTSRLLAGDTMTIQDRPTTPHGMVFATVVMRR